MRPNPSRYTRVVDLDSFIAKYRPEWRRLEEATAHGSRGVAKRGGEGIAEVVRLYQRASTHLTEVRSSYGDPQLEGYLNGVVGRAHAALYGGGARSRRDVAALFGSRYREAARRTAPFILITAAVTVLVTLALALWVSSSHEAQAGVLPGFARDAIQRAGGHRIDIGVAPAELSALILLNNLKVMFLAFGLGIGLGIGTLYVLAQNAILLGALAGGYAAAGKAWVFWSLVLPHGLLEITGICIAAGAGLRMGWSLIDPGDRPRGRALAEEARDAVLVVVGVIPAFGIAAFIEGFVTGRTGNAVVEVAVGAVVTAGYVTLLFGRIAHRRPAALARK